MLLTGEDLVLTKTVDQQQMQVHGWWTIGIRVWHVCIELIRKMVLPTFSSSLSGRWIRSCVSWSVGWLYNKEQGTRVIYSGASANTENRYYYHHSCRFIIASLVVLSLCGIIISISAVLCGKVSSSGHCGGWNDIDQSRELIKFQLILSAAAVAFVSEGEWPRPECVAKTGL